MTNSFIKEVIYMEKDTRKQYAAPMLFIDSFAPDTMISSMFGAMFGTYTAADTAAEAAAAAAPEAPAAPMNGDAQSCWGSNTVIGDAQGGEVCVW